MPNDLSQSVANRQGGRSLSGYRPLPTEDRKPAAISNRNPASLGPSSRDLVGFGQAVPPEIDGFVAQRPEGAFGMSPEPSVRSTGRNAPVGAIYDAVPRASARIARATNSTPRGMFAERINE